MDHFLHGNPLRLLLLKCKSSIRRITFYQINDWALTVIHIITTPNQIINANVSLSQNERILKLIIKRVFLPQIQNSVVITDNITFLMCQLVLCLPVIDLFYISVFGFWIWMDLLKKESNLKI